MGQPQARIGDMHMCNMPAPPTPAGPVPPAPLPLTAVGAPTVLVGNLPAARVGDFHASGTGPHAIAKGSTTVIIMGQPAARIGDIAGPPCGGAIIKGEPTVLVGG